MPGHRLTHTRSVPQGGSKGKAVPSPRQRGPALSVTPWSGGLQVWVDASLHCACQDVCGPCTNVTVAKVCGQIRQGQLQRLRVDEVWGWWKTLSPSPWKASPHPFFPGSTSLRSQLFSLLPPEQHRGMGNGGCGQSITVPLCYSVVLTLFPWGPSHRLQSFEINLLQHGLSSSHHSLRKYPTSPVLGPPQTAGIVFFTVVFSTGCRRLSALQPGAPLLPPSSPTLVFAGLFLTLLSPLSSPTLAVVSFLKYAVTEVPPASLMSLVLAGGGSILEPAGTSSVWHGGSP